MNYFLQNPISALMVVCAIIIFGVIALIRLPVSLLPRMEYPALSVIIEYPGISPEKIEHIITRPVERAIRSVAGIEGIESSSEEGKARITITLHPEVDVKIAALKVREKIALIRDSFPRAVQEPVVLRYDPTDRPALIAAVKKIPDAHATPTAIREYAEHFIKPKLQRIDGVSEIQVAGGLVKEIHVTIDGGKFFSRGLDFSEIVRALQRESVSIPAGSIFSGGREFRLRLPERFRSVEDISRVVLRSYDGTRLCVLNDIAKVEASTREIDSVARHNGEERVLIYLHKAGDANTLAVTREAQRILTTLEGCDIEIIYSQADYIRAAVGNAVYSGLFGLFIVLIVVCLFYRDVLKAGAIAISIPLSIIATFALMYFAHIEINIVSLSGLALAAGMVVDSSILVMEAITPGLSLEKTVSAISRIRVAATASTLTTVAVFFPLLFAEETTRRTYSDMAFTVTSACIISLIVSTMLIPSLYLASTKISSTRTFAIAIPRLCEDIIEKARVRYDAALSHVMANKRRAFIVTGIFSLVSLLFFFMLRQEFIDPFAGDELYLFCELPTGTPLRIVDEATRRVEERIRQSGYAEKISSKAENWRGSIAITLKKSFLGSRHDEARALFKEQARDILRSYSGFAFLSEAEETANRELDIIFTGKDDDTLRRIAREAARALETISGIEECILRFREGKPSYRLLVDKDASQIFGVPSDRLAHFFHGMLFGPVALKHQTDEREIDVRVKFDRARISDVRDMLSGSLPAGENRFMPLSQFIRVEEAREPTRLSRINARRAVRITARLSNISFDDAAKRIHEKLSSMRLPEDYGWEFDTGFEKAQKNIRRMALLVVAALLVVYMVMAAILESLRLPLLIIATVPLGICGVFFAFFLCGMTMSTPAFMGLVVLSGISVNNGIVIAERVANCVKRSKRSFDGAHIDAIAIRKSLAHFRPLFATTLTTIVGFIPALISFGEGSALWRPLALAVISGLAASSLASGLILPASIRHFIVKNGRHA